MYDLNWAIDVHSFVFSPVRDVVSTTLNYYFKRGTDATEFFFIDHLIFQWSNLSPIEKNSYKIQASYIANCGSCLSLVLITQPDSCIHKQTERISAQSGIMLTRSTCSILDFISSRISLSRTNLSKLSWKLWFDDSRTDRKWDMEHNVRITLDHWLLLWSSGNNKFHFKISFWTSFLGNESNSYDWKHWKGRRIICLPLWLNYNKMGFDSMRISTKHSTKHLGNWGRESWAGRHLNIPPMLSLANPKW